MRVKGLAWYVNWRLRNDYDTYIVIDGDKGTGKSTTTLRLFETFDKKPNIRQVFFNAATVLYLIKELLRDYRVAKNWTGKWGVLEEWGQATEVTQAGAVQEMLKASDVLRKYKINFLINLPNRYRLPKQLLYDHATIWIWCKGRDKNKGKVYASWRLRLRWEDGVEMVNPDCVSIHPVTQEHRLIRTDIYKIGKPIVFNFCSSELWEKYERWKDQYFINYQIPAALSRIKRLSQARNLLENQIILADDSEFEDDELNLSPRERRKRLRFLELFSEKAMRGEKMTVSEAARAFVSNNYTKENKIPIVKIHLEQLGLADRFKIEGKYVVAKR